MSGDESMSPMDSRHQECAGCVCDRNLGFSSGTLIPVFLRNLVTM